MNIFTEIEYFHWNRIFSHSNWIKTCIQESAARRFKDEIYKVHDTLEDLNEIMKDSKSYSRDNLENSDSIKDKVIKIHKHLKVREVLGTDNRDPEEVPLEKILQRTVVPELQTIKKLCNSSVFFREKSKKVWLTMVIFVKICPKFMVLVSVVANTYRFWL